MKKNTKKNKNKKKKHAKTLKTCVVSKQNMEIMPDMLCRGACTIIYFTTKGKHTPTFFHVNMKNMLKTLKKH